MRKLLKLINSIVSWLKDRQKMVKYVDQCLTKHNHCAPPKGILTLLSKKSKENRKYPHLSCFILKLTPNGLISAADSTGEKYKTHNSFYAASLFYSNTVYILKHIFLLSKQPESSLSDGLHWLRPVGFMTSSLHRRTVRGLRWAVLAPPQN